MLQKVLMFLLLLFFAQNSFAQTEDAYKEAQKKANAKIVSAAETKTVANKLWADTAKDRIATNKKMEKIKLSEEDQKTVTSHLLLMSKLDSSFDKQIENGNKALKNASDYAELGRTALTLTTGINNYNLSNAAGNSAILTYGNAIITVVDIISLNTKIEKILSSYQENQ